MNIEGTPYEETPYLGPEKIWGEDCSQLLANTSNSNTLQKDKQAVTMNLLITPSISSQEHLSPSEFFKIYSLVVNVFIVKTKQLLSPGRIKK